MADPKGTWLTPLLRKVANQEKLKRIEEPGSKIRADIEQWNHALGSAAEEAREHCVVIYLEGNGTGPIRRYRTNELRLEAPKCA